MYYVQYHEFLCFYILGFSFKLLRANEDRRPTSSPSSRSFRKRRMANEGLQSLILGVFKFRFQYCYLEEGRV